MNHKFTLMFLLLFQFSFAQNNASIEAKVNSFFELMNQKNHKELESFFIPDAMLQSFAMKNDMGEYSSETLADFLFSIQQLPESISIEEKIDNLVVQVDGFIAFASMDYEFYVNKNYSHSGKNYFQFIYLNGDWLIAHIFDSRIYLE